MPRRAELPNLSPARLDIPHYRGDSLSATLWFQSQGVPIDVSAWTFAAEIRESPDGAKIANFTPYTDTQGGDAVNGKIRLVLPTISAEAFPASCVWDLEATDADLRVRTLLRGYIYTPADVTHPESGGAVLMRGR